ncbi:hypothetical protein BDP27DRAFT_1368513 [Rhodocollybia butyracea]|uniref:Uncharacterized protein n=1 Tax=Rhodocollybia butyracea TaxID=206335 RepID=A0A9P5PGJ6_9AGAR|nr:hypothetical protein BDP27DRAFT_1368513 [Rhodocollybia butyracea]
MALVKLGTEEAMRKFRSDLSAPVVEDGDVNEDGTVPTVQAAPGSFNFDWDLHIVTSMTIHKMVFEWRGTLFNLREKEGWNIWQEIKQMFFTTMTEAVAAIGFTIQVRSLSSMASGIYQRYQDPWPPDEDHDEEDDALAAIAAVQISTDWV